MFRSTTIIRQIVLNLAEVIFMLKHSVKLRRYMLFGDVAAGHRAVCVLCAVHTTHTPLCDLHQNSYCHECTVIKCTSHNVIVTINW